MFIATCAAGCVKLRRSGMNGAGDHDQADPDPMPLLRSLARRSGAIAAINMALLMELSRLRRPQMRVRGRVAGRTPCAPLCPSNGSARTE